jgi:hypothetical protein
MARTIILELTDEQEQQLLRQAQQLNLPIESVLLRAALQIPQGSLMQNSSPPAPHDEEYMLRFFLLSDLFSTMRAARLAGQTTTEVPATEIVLNLLQTIKGGELITDFQTIERDGQQHLLLHLAPERDKSAITSSPQFDQIDPTLPPELAMILKDLNHEDPLIREQAVISLGELARESR